MLLIAKKRKVRISKCKWILSNQVNKADKKKDIKGFKNSILRCQNPSKL